MWTGILKLSLDWVQDYVGKQTELLLLSPWKKKKVKEGRSLMVVIVRKRPEEIASCGWTGIWVLGLSFTSLSCLLLLFFSPFIHYSHISFLIKTQKWAREKKKRRRRRKKPATTYIFETWNVARLAVALDIHEMLPFPFFIHCLSVWHHQRSSDLFGTITSAPSSRSPTGEERRGGMRRSEGGR